MILDDVSVAEILENPKLKHKIQSVRLLESQLRVFTEELSENEIKSERYWNDFQEKMKVRSEKKFERVLKFARFPLPVVQLTDSILNDFFRVFEGKNKFFNVEGDREIPRLKEWIEENKPSKWIEDESKRVFKNKPSSIVVVDKDEKGNPYLINICSERLHDVQFKNEFGECEYVSFIHSVTESETLYSVYDDAYYYVYSKGHDSSDFVQVKKIPHFIGYCPAKAFVKTRANEKNELKRRIAFSSALSKLEDWTLFDIFRNYVDHYAPFPVTEAVKNKCANPECQDGKIHEEIIDQSRQTGFRSVWHDCPVCKGEGGGQHIFPGTHIGLQINPEDKNNGQGVFRMIFPETDKLKYTPEKLDDLEIDIRLKCVGINDISNEAFNEMQIKGSFATMESIFLRTKSELDHLFKWIVLTVGRSFYSNLKLKTEANFGTEWYLVSEEDLQKRYKEAKSIGLPMEEQLNIYKQLVETKYKGNATKLDRNLMFLDLDPFPLNSNEECFKFKSEGIIDDFDLSLKVNFLKFISKFENENVPITQFGINLEYWKRIENIKESLEKYNQELIDKKNKRTTGSP